MHQHAENELLSRKSLAELTAEVLSTIKKFTWFQRHGVEIGAFFLRIAAFALGFYFFAQEGLLWKAFALAYLSYIYFGIATTGIHETSHRAFFRSPRLNKIAAYFFSDFWGSQSNLWWYYRHVQEHHTYTNMPEKEEQSFFFPWLNKYLYMWGVPLLITPWLIGRSIKFLWGQWGKLALYLICMLAGLAFHTWLFALFVPLPWAILSMFLMRIIFAPFVMHIAVFNHIGLEVLYQDTPWLPHQTRTTRNLKNNWFLTFLGGNSFVDCHIEHHIFPTLSHAMLAKVHPIVMKYLTREGYKYIEETYTSCLRQCLKHYHTIFSQAKIEV